MITNITARADSYPAVRFPYWHCSVENDAGVKFELMSNCNESHYEDTDAHVAACRAMLGALFVHNVAGLPEIEIQLESVNVKFERQSASRYVNPVNEGTFYFTIRSADVKSLFPQGLKFKCFHYGAMNKADCFEQVKGFIKPQFHQELTLVEVNAA